MLYCKTFALLVGKSRGARSALCVVLGVALVVASRLRFEWVGWFLGDLRSDVAFVVLWLRLLTVVPRWVTLVLA